MYEHALVDCDDTLTDAQLHEWHESNARAKERDRVRRAAAIVRGDRPYLSHDLVDQATGLVLAGNVWRSMRGWEVMEKGGQQFTVKQTKSGPPCNCRLAQCLHQAAAYVAEALESIKEEEPNE